MDVGAAGSGGGGAVNWSDNPAPPLTLDGLLAAAREIEEVSKYAWLARSLIVG